MANKVKNRKKDWVVARLQEVAAGDISNVSYYMLVQLINDNYLKPVFEKTSDGVGRPTKKYVLAARAKRLMVLANYWPKAA